MPAESNAARTVGWCALAIILALYVVGTVSHGVIRHIVQTAPIWPAVWLGTKRSEWAKWAAFPSYIFWLVLMVIIWTFLLGWTHIIRGTFSPTEITMTIIIAIASAVGIVTALKSRTAVGWLGGTAILVLFGCLQWLAFRISTLPQVSRDPW